MKTPHAIVLVLAIALTACSKGVKKDFGTGLSVNYNGFSIEEAILIDENSQAKSDNDVNLNSNVAIVVQGIQNYVLKDDKAFPGLALSVTDNQGNAVIDEADLFADTDGYPADQASVLRGTVTVGNPMQAGQTYHVKMRIWDKNKAESEIVAEVDLDVI
jgi:hypothetical protein